MTTATMSLVEAARVLRDALRDERYKLLPMGTEVEAYMRAKQKQLTKGSDSNPGTSPAGGRVIPQPEPNGGGQMIRVNFSCGGCDATAEATRPPRREFVPVNPGGSFGRYRVDDFEDVTPEGWVAFDPYTGATYCPSCWESIVSDKPELSSVRLGAERGEGK